MDQLFRFSKAHEKDRDQLEIITVHHDLDSAADAFTTKMPQLLRGWGLEEFPYPVAFDSTGKTEKDFGVERFPTTVFIAPDGRISPVNGVWGLSEILKGRNGMMPETFVSADSNQAAAPAPIRPSNDKGGRLGDRYVVLKGHSDTVSAVEFMPGGEELVTAGSDLTIRLWNVDAGRQERLIPCKPDSGSLVSSYGEIQVFTAQNGGLVGGRYLEPGRDGIERSLRLWRRQSGYQDFVSLKDPEIHLGQMAVSGDGRLVAASAYAAERTRSP
jgi:WD40 repeat protein